MNNPFDQVPGVPTGDLFNDGQKEVIPDAFGTPTTALNSPESAERKTRNVMIGLGSEDSGISRDQVKASFTAGMEDQLRAQLASNEDMAVFKRKQEILKQIIDATPSGHIDPQVYDTVVNLTSQEVKSDPGTIIEKKLARAVINHTLNRDGGEKYNQALAEDQETTDKVTDGLEKRIEYTQVINSMISDLEDKVSEQGTLPWLADKAKSFLPFYTQVKRRNITEDQGFFSQMVTPGSSIQAEREYLFSLPLSEFKKVVGDRLAAVAKDNPSLAIEFAHELREFTSNDAFWTSALGAIDYTAIPSPFAVAKGAKAVKGLLKGTNAVKDTADVVADVGKTLAHPKAELHDVVAATGDTKAAVDIAAATKPEVVTPLKDLLKEASSTEEAARFIEQHVPNIAAPLAEFPDTPFDIAKGYSARLKEVMEANSQFGIKSLFEVNSVSRLDKTAELEALSIDQARDQVTKLFGGDSTGAVARTTFIPGSETGVNVDRVAVDLGKTDGTLFDTVDELTAAVKRSYGLNADNLETVKIGDKYAARFMHNVDEWDPAMRKLILTSNTETPVTTAKMWLGHIMTADANLSKGQQQVRSIATGAQGEIQRLVGAMAEPIGQLSKDEFKNLGLLMDDLSSRVVKRPGSNEMTRGVFAKTQYEFADEYFNKFHEWPSPKQTEAYFTAVQLSDLDYLARNWEIYKYKASRGYGGFSFNLQRPLKDAEDAFERVSTHAIEGKFVDRLPLESGENARVVVIDNGVPVIFDTHKLTEEAKQVLKEHIEASNSKIVQVADPLKNPLREYLPNYKDPDPIEFVVSKDPKFSKLSMKQLEYNEGGHAVENVNWRIKSPKVAQTTKGPILSGETTFSGHVLEREAAQFHRDMEALRTAMKDAESVPVGRGANRVSRDYSAVEQVLRERGLPFTLKEAKGLFAKDGPLSLDHPLALVRDGQKYGDVVNLKGMGVRDYASSPHNLAGEMSRAFTQERGMGTLTYEWGGEKNPIWMANKARMMEATRVLQRTLGDVLESRVYNDYVIRSAREFTEQFGDLIVGGKEKLRQAPIWNMLHPQWNTRADPVQLAAAKKMQRAVSLLVYSPSEMSKQVSATKGALLNGVFDRFGKEAALMLEDSTIYKTRDPTSFFRATAFHSTMGLFNPVQLVLNTVSLAHITAISPKHAIGAIKDSILMRWLQSTGEESITRAILKKAEHPHLEEMHRELIRSGFGDINGTTSYLDDALSPKTIQTKWGRFLDFGLVFFKESEAGLRRAAWATAYREWRDANPYSVLKDMDRQTIMMRAKNLNLQMSRESQNIYQNGIWSIPLQFTSYTNRVSEQLLEGVLTGKGALSRAEAARAIGLYSVLYGLPTGVGAAAGIVPIYDSLKQYALDKGIDLDANRFTQFVSRGILNVLYDMGGNGKMNFAERYGPGNSSFVTDILSGKKSLLEAALGPSGSMVKSMLQGADPLLHKLGSTINGEDYPLLASDMVGLANGVSSVSNATKAYMAYQSGMWMTKNGVVQTDVAGESAVWMALLGLSPQEAADAYPAMKVLSNHSAAKKEIVQEAQKEWSFAMKALQNGDKPLMDDHLKRLAYLVKTSGMNPNEQATMMGQIMKAHESQWNELSMRLIEISRTPEEYRRKIDNRVKYLEQKGNR